MKKMLGIACLSVVLLSACQGQSERTGEAESEEPKKEETEIMEEVKPTFTFVDVEKLKKAESFEEAFDNYFGHDRHFTAYEYGDENEEILFGGPIRELDSTQIADDTLEVYIEMKRGVDTRAEMIDFLHYLKVSGLLEVKEPFPNDPYGDVFKIRMMVYPETKPGMNTPQVYQTWEISNKKVKAMDFSDKSDILESAGSYGKW
ncbi:hypothetical protein [Peribacillus frigoritolerans]|uniref:hypothetical protein n=1 Tax=Peribacillus castrilensis TaxID=2897690 RepID=UPI002DC0B691|nr:hypothetical protein [Peribacillus castrilensis]